MQAAHVAAGAAADHQQEAAAAADVRWHGQVKDLETSLQSWQDHCEELTARSGQQQQSLQSELQVMPQSNHHDCPCQYSRHSECNLADCLSKALSMMAREDSKPK